MNCPVCLSNNIQDAGTVKSYQVPLYIKRCNNCNSLFQFPLPENVKGMYDEAYYSGTADYAYRDERNQYEYDKHVHFSRLNTMRRFIPSGRLLDVGCSFGSFVKSANQFYDAYGIDLSSFAAKQGNAWLQEQRVFEGTLSTPLPSELFANGSYQVITLFEVAEHLVNPRAELQRAFQLLSPGGMLVIQTANFAAWQAIEEGLDYAYFMPGHLVYYTANGLKGMLAEIGFKRFKEFTPVDFSLIAKLKKSKGSMKKSADYFRWLRISWYHIKSKFKRQGLPLTSSYVLYAFKED